MDKKTLAAYQRALRDAVREVGEMPKEEIHSSLRRVAANADATLKARGKPRTPQLQSLFDWLERNGIQ